MSDEEEQHDTAADIMAHKLQQFIDEGSSTPLLKRKPGETTKQKKNKISNEEYLTTLAKLQLELVKAQAWIREKGLRVVVLFEGRDAAGKGGVIKRITEHLNPRVCKVVALGTPTDREKKQWYFQRYITHLPAKGEMVLFDRSWYNRGGVERVMGFCTDDEYEKFLVAAPKFEKMLQDDGFIVIKYWFSVSDKEQEKRFQERMQDPTKQWKISPMDLASRARWVDYSKAKDAMMAATHTKNCQWYVVESNNKKKARLNCISHLLTLIPYAELPMKKLQLTEKQVLDYKRPPKGTNETLVPDRY